MSRWDKEELELKKSHRWRGKPGHKIFVGDRGAIRFDYPEDWVVMPDDDSIKFYDKQPPDDDCCLAVSYMRLPKVDLSRFPVSEMLKVAMKSDSRPIYSRSEIHQVTREDLELAWVEMAFVDPLQHRDCRSRMCLGRGSDIQPLITMEFWEDDRERCEPVWDDVLDSLQLGMFIDDPTRGPVVQ